MFEPIQQRRAFEEICASIRDRLASGVLSPGDKLPPERVLAEQLGVGRNALREALRSLEMAGVVELRTGVKGGAFIREGDPAGMTQVIEDLLYLGAFSMAALTEARVLLMDTVVRLACERATSAQLQALRANIERTAELTRSGRLLDRVGCASEFYQLLAQATGNPVLEMLVASLTRSLMKFVHIRVAAGGAPQPGLVESRREFLALLQARDADKAAAHMKRHLAAVHRLLGDPIARGRSGAVERQAVPSRARRAARPSAAGARPVRRAGQTATPSTQVEKT